MNRTLLALGVLTPLTVLSLAADRRPETRWFRGNLHTHTLWSDGNDFPEMVVDWYRQQGAYHFLALSDHNVIQAGTRWIDNDVVIRRGGRTALSEYRERFGDDLVETRDGDDGKLEVRLRTLDEFRGQFEAADRFLLIRAEEVTDAVDGAPIHINATNVADVVKPRHGASVREVMRNNLAAIAEHAASADRPVIAHLNHPNFGWGITAEDLAHVVEERFFEVWNGHPGVHHRGDDQHASVERLWDIANAIRIQELEAPPLFGVGTDDCHNYHNATGSTPGRGWVEVRATELTPEAITAAMAAGDFYASSGVRLADVRFADGELVVVVDPVDGESYEIAFVTTPRGTDLSGAPVLDDEGNELRATRRYPDAVGETRSVVQGNRASYRLRGDELYVRAVVTSSATVENPVWEGQRKTAWTQPVGWRAQVDAGGRDGDR